MTTIPELPNSTPLEDDDIMLARDVSTGVDRRYTVGAVRAGGVRAVPDIPALLALEGVEDGQAAQVTGTGRAGLFRWQSGDLSAEVAGDPMGGIYVPTAGGDGSAGSWVKEGGSLSESVVLTVGSGGSFQTINAALDFASRFRPVNNSASPTTLTDTLVRIRLLSGFVMQEQVICKGVDLGYIVIESEDAEVVVDGDYVTQQFPEGPNRFPVFFAYENATLPVIGTLFALDDEKAKANIYGIRTFQSRAFILLGAGFKNCSGANGRCAEFARSSVISAPGSVWEAGGAVNVRISNNSVCDLRDAVSINGVFNLDVGGGCCVNAQNSVLTGASARGLSITGPAMVQAIGCDVSGSQGEGLRVTNSTALVHFEAATATGCNIGIRAANGAIVNAANADVSGCTTGVSCSEGAKVVGRAINASGCVNIGIHAFDDGEVVAQATNCDDCGLNAIRIENGGAVTATGGTGRNAGQIGVRCYPGGRFDGATFDCSGSLGTAGLDARQGARVNFQGGNARRGETDDPGDIQMTSGCIVNAVGATGGTNRTPNAVSIHGIMFK